MDGRLIEFVVPLTEGTEAWVRRRFRLQAADAEDVVRDALLDLLRSNPQGVKHPRAYFYAACARRAWKFIRRIRRTRSLSSLDLSERLESHAPTPVELPSFERLTPRQKDVISLAAVGCPPTEAAARLGISPSTARWTLFQARKTLRRHAA